MKRILHLACLVAGTMSIITAATGNEPVAVDQNLVGLPNREVEASIMRHLMKPVTIDWQDVPLLDLINRFDDDYGVPMQVDKVAWENARTQLTSDVRVSLKLNDVPLREVLNKLTLVVEDLAWAVRGDRILLTPGDDHESEFFIRVYDVSKILKRRSEQEVLDIYATHAGFGAGEGFFSWGPERVDADQQANAKSNAGFGIPVNPYYALDELAMTLQHFLKASWYDFGYGNGTINGLVIGSRPVLVINQTFSGHAQIATLLAQLESASDINIEPRIVDPRIMVDRDWAQENFQREAALMEKLYTIRVSFDWEDVPISTALGELAKQHSFNFLIDEKAFGEVGIQVDELVSGQAANVSLLEAFDLATQFIGDITYHVDGSTVVVTSIEHTPWSLRVYDVTPLVERPTRIIQTRVGGTDEEPVLEIRQEVGRHFATDNLFALAEDLVGGDSWRPCGGECHEADVLEFNDRVVFVVNRNMSGHQELASLFDNLRSFQKQD